MKNKEQVIEDDLKALLTGNEEFDYVLYGKLAPQTKRILILFGIWIAVAFLVMVKLLPFGWYLLGIILLLFLITYMFFYDTVYLAKFGKNVYIHVFSVFHLKDIKDKILLKNLNVVEDRSSEFHLTIQLMLEGNNQFIIFRRKSDEKGYPNQTTNMKKLKLDINKKHKK